jgi:1-acyl-sn-glycerol-3-phosphate acyltransferase
MQMNLTLGQRLSRASGRALGWRVVVEQPVPDKCVIVGAPHTSLWDWAAAMLLMAGTNLRFRWLAKDTAFWWPLGVLLRGLGGWPVNRRSRNNLVQQVVDAFNTHDLLRIAISPEGTRRVAGYWKTGFYYMALGAAVPIVMGYVDYRRRIVGFGPSFMPSGDIYADFEILRQFYAQMTGKHAGGQSLVQVRPVS